MLEGITIPNTLRYISENSFQFTNVFIYKNRFFKQYLLLVVINQTASALFRSIGALGRNIIVANTFGSCALLTVLVLGGFVMSRSIHCSIYRPLTCVFIILRDHSYIGMKSHLCNLRR